MPDGKPDDTPDAARDRMLQYRHPPGLKRWGLTLLAVAVIVVVVGIGWRWHRSVQARAWTNEQAIPAVQLIRLGTPKGGGTLNLPGQLQAFVSASIHPQVSGVILKWTHDIGAKVKKGDLLAQIDPRPYQAALDQAKGQMARDSATLANARVDLNRYQALSAQNAISQQQLAAQKTAVAAGMAIVEADKAAVETARINLEYTRIVAPFDGTVTSRNIDIGNLVTTGGTAPALFTVSDQHRLRLYVNVPENYIAAIRPGITVAFAVPQAPGRTFQAEFVASAGAINQSSGTTLVQFYANNPDDVLQPGGYAQVTLPLPPGVNGVRVPATALLFRDQGMAVATVTTAGRVHMKPIHIMRDLGQTVDATGVSPRDRIINNPSDSLSEGDRVQVVTAE